MGTTAAQKKLFFNLRKLKGQMQAIDEGDLRPETVKAIAERLDVTENDVVEMNRRLEGSDHSLNVPLRSDSETQWQDWLVDDAASQESTVADADEFDHRMSLLHRAMAVLNERERHILSERRLKDEPTTLEELSAQYGISRERVRQIEVRAFEKLQRAIKALEAEQAASARLPPPREGAQAHGREPGQVDTDWPWPDPFGVVVQTEYQVAVGGHQKPAIVLQLLVELAGSPAGIAQGEHALCRPLAGGDHPQDVDGRGERDVVVDEQGEVLSVVGAVQDEAAAGIHRPTEMDRHRLAVAPGVQPELVEQGVEIQAVDQAVDH